MPRTILTLVLISFIVSGIPVFAEPAGDYFEVTDAIKNAELTLARQKVAELLSRDFADWELTYLNGLLMVDGELSVSEMEKALLLCKDDCEKLLNSLATAYYTFGRYRKLADFYREHKGKADDHDEAFQFYWYSSLAYLKLGDRDEAEDVAGEVKKFRQYRSWEELLRANYDCMGEDLNDCVKRYNEVISAGGTPALLALYNRTYLQARNGRTDQGFSGYTMLSEHNSEFLGSREILELLEIYQGIDIGGEAEHLTGVRYTIQIGTYADKEQAEFWKRQLEVEGYDATVRARDVDGRRYWTVAVGRYDTVEKAQAVKQTLENIFSGSYRVVIMD